MKFRLTNDGVIERTEDWPEEADWLELSIEKWRFAESCIKAGREIYHGGGDDTCGLCHKHCFCDTCPIYLVTGEKYCKRTPYEEWTRVMMNDQPMTLEIAQAEIRLLEGLREV